MPRGEREGPTRWTWAWGFPFLTRPDQTGGHRAGTGSRTRSSAKDLFAFSHGTSSPTHVEVEYPFVG
jgi:hypothetical protein